ncbi:hypothetical protein L3V82_10960 [Thiotrichales bacterium 19S3-7]|nr:hypothetical protein [Thiotrichales bacterium 19S3-7]MCF6802699.1 hypothetical protein [Thiotrichales bacterium 19S3-11]
MKNIKRFLEESKLPAAYLLKRYLSDNDGNIRFHCMRYFAINGNLDGCDLNNKEQRKEYENRFKYTQNQSNFVFHNQEKAQDSLDNHFDIL